ncbi:MAG: hypothetical protein RLZZ500_215 [Bacteroidota bacterium]|jgi:opacity protein-like surface antigen
MKKVIVMLLFALGGSSLHAQLVKFGLKAGVNFANYQGGNVQNIDFNTLTSYHAGLVTEVKLFENFALQPEFLYSTQGSELKGLGTQVKNELGYLSVPVLVKFYLTKNRLSLELGPQASVLVNQRNNVNLGDSNTFDFAVAGGLSYKITNGLFVSGRYTAGLTEPKRDATVKNAVVQFSLGYLF